MSESKRPLVTIGICTYNRAEGYLQDALRSAVAQEYPNLEIVVSDNASTDRTEEVVNAFEDPRIRYFKQPRNLGVNGNFNFCLEQARGAYFLLLHDDDVIDPDFIEVCMDAAKDETHHGLIRTGTRVIDDVGRVKREVPNRVGGLSTADFFLGWFEKKTALYFCSTLFHTARLKEIGGFQSKTELFQDVVAYAELAASHGRVDVEEVKASFRQHGSNNGSSARVVDWCEDSRYVLDVMCRVAPESADTIRREGLRYFTRTNYRHTDKIPAPLERARMYWNVYRRFDRTYSPFQYFYSKQLRRLERLTGRGDAPGSLGDARAPAAQGG